MYKEDPSKNASKQNFFWNFWQHKFSFPPCNPCNQLWIVQQIDPSNISEQNHSAFNLKVPSHN